MARTFWTHDMRHVGRFSGDEVYASDSSYLGEIKSGYRLISNNVRHRGHPASKDSSRYGLRADVVATTEHSPSRMVRLPLVE